MLRADKIKRQDNEIDQVKITDRDRPSHRDRDGRC